MNKRAIAILGAIFILIVGTLGFLIYQRQSKVKDNQETNGIVDQQPVVPELTDPGAEQQPQLSGKAVKLTDEEVISPILFYQGNGITYFSNQGQLFQTDLQVTNNSVLLSNKRELTIALKSGMNRILWPQTGNNFIAETMSGGQKRWSFYNSDTGAYIDYPAEVRAVDWFPSADKVLLIWVDGNGQATLNSANPDLTNYQKITDMYEPDDDIAMSPDGKGLLFWRTQNREGRNVISWLSPDGKAYKAVASDGYNLGAKWSPDSRRFVFGKRDAQTQQYQLWLADLISGEIRNLNINTIPEKVTWSKDGGKLYAAVPRKGSPGFGLTEDTFYQINIAGTDRQEFDPGIAADGGDLFLSTTESILFFKNRQDRSLYYISLIK